MNVYKPVIIYEICKSQEALSILVYWVYHKKLDMASWTCRITCRKCCTQRLAASGRSSREAHSRNVTQTLPNIDGQECS